MFQQSMMNSNSPEQTTRDWLHHKVSNFLNSLTLFPDVLHVQDNGWVEAYFRTPSRQEHTIEEWYRLEQGSYIQLDHPLRDVETPDGVILRVRFRLVTQ